MGKNGRQSRARPGHVKYWYDGPTEERKMEKVPIAAYRSWRDQRQRCNNPKSVFYKHYGAKGIKVEYCAREFVGWWISEYSKRQFKKAVCGRIDHDKSYCFDNIVLQDQTDNANELIDRRSGMTNLKYKRKRIGILDNNNKIIREFASISLASKDLNVLSSTIVRHLQGKFKHAGGFRFKCLD